MRALASTPRPLLYLHRGGGGFFDLLLAQVTRARLPLFLHPVAMEEGWEAFLPCLKGLGFAGAVLEEAASAPEGSASEAEAEKARRVDLLVPAGGGFSASTRKAWPWSGSSPSASPGPGPCGLGPSALNSPPSSGASARSTWPPRATPKGTPSSPASPPPPGPGGPPPRGGAGLGPPGGPPPPEHAPPAFGPGPALPRRLGPRPRGPGRGRAGPALPRTGGPLERAGLGRPRRPGAHPLGLKEVEEGPPRLQPHPDGPQGLVFQGAAGGLEGRGEGPTGPPPPPGWPRGRGGG